MIDVIEEDSIERLDMRSLLVDVPSVPATALLDDAVQILSSEDYECLAVAENGKVLGLCSRKRIASMFSQRFGRALFSRATVGEHMEDEFLCVRIDQPIVDILGQVFSREEKHFWKDVIVVDEDDRYLGLFKVTSLAKLQNQLVSEKLEHLEERGNRLEDANDSLRQLTDKLQNANVQLELARDESLQAVRSKSEFLAVMSHEIRTPLNGILGMLSLLVDTRLDEEQRELATTANESAEALLLILNDILDFSRLDSGKFSLEENPFDVRELAESVLTLMAENAQERGLEVICEIDLDVPECLTSDSGRIRQILANMIGNAVKFTNEGEISLRISKEPGRMGHVRFEVTDSGIGISKSAQEKLFSPFAQADSSTTRLYGGTGLGLAICKKLVNAMGGEIGLTSEEGAGSTFWFTIQCRSKNQPMAAYSPKRYGEGLEALVGIENQRLAEVLGRELRARGIEMRLARTQTEFTGVLERETPALDILFAEEAFLPPSMKTVPDSLPMVVIRTAHGGPSCTENRAYARLNKPVRLGQLDRVLSRLFGASDRSDKGVQITTSREQPCCANTQFDARILLVEDHAVNRRLVQKLLERLGYQCDVAVDGVEATEFCRAKEYQLILLDCNMPRMDGYEFARWLRNYEQDCSLERSLVVALTANAMQGDKESCLASGMDQYISKPVKKSVLEEILTSLFKAEKQVGLRVEKG